MKKSPQNMDMMVKRRSIMVSLTSSCPNIVSQHNFLSLIFSLRSFWYWLVTTEQSSREELGDGQVWSLPRFISAFSHRRRLAINKATNNGVLFLQIREGGVDLVFSSPFFSTCINKPIDFSSYQSLYQLFLTVSWDLRAYCATRPDGVLISLLWSVVTKPRQGSC